MWIPFHESSVRIVIYIIVMWTPFNWYLQTLLDITIPTEVSWNGVHRTMIDLTILIMLLFSQGCLDLDVSRHITTIEEKLNKYSRDENIATDKTSIFDCVAECFTKRFVERCPQDNTIYNNSHRGFVERYPHDNNIYNNSHRGFVERYPNDNNNYKTSGQKEKYKRQTTIYKTYT
jgi:hypothetical protein